MSAAVSRGNQTRDALIKAATVVFGKAGFDAASTRAIADAAGANQALINYHFGGKEGLYQAVFQSLADEMEVKLTPAIDALRAEMPLRGESAIKGIENLLSVMIEQFGREDMTDWTRLIAREQQDPSPAFEIVYDRFMSRLLGLLAELVQGASQGQLKVEEARLRAMLIAGQVLVFVYAPAAVERFLGWGIFDPDSRTTVTAHINQLVRSQFTELTK